VIGTDSLASNDQLDVAAEIGVLAQNFPRIPLAALLKWATSTGAEALRWPQLGSFEKGKQPGGVLLQPNFSVERLF
jgi:cytosine/adenosine deaminase-related metal-dependent hydrolase